MKPIILPNIKRVTSTKFFICLLAFLILLQGCAPAKHRRRGKLSEAMEKASDDYKGKRTVEPSKDEDDEYFITTDTDKKTNHSASYRKIDTVDHTKDDMGMFGLMGGVGFITGDDFYELNHFNASFGGDFNDKSRGDLFLGFL